MCAVEAMLTFNSLTEGKKERIQSFNKWLAHKNTEQETLISRLEW